MTQDSRTIHLIIKGRVQGVYFRAWTEENARRLGLNGWVRNRRDGSVETVFNGGHDAVEQMMALCREGPPDARVEAVDVVQEGGAAPAGFEVRPTA